MADSVTLEFWPEYDSGPLWSADGETVPLDELPLPVELRHRLNCLERGVRRPTPPTSRPRRVLAGACIRPQALNSGCMAGGTVRGRQPRRRRALARDWNAYA
jgi:hypothetical protein